MILFIGLNAYSSVPLTASDIYLGTGLPKRTVIRIIDRLEALNVVKKTAASPGSASAQSSPDCSTNTFWKI